MKADQVNDIIKSMHKAIPRSWVGSGDARTAPFIKKKVYRVASYRQD